MKIIALLSAGALAAAGFAAVPADAQRRGWDGYRDGRGWHDNRGWRGDRGWRGHRGWNGNRGWNGSRGWNGNRGWNGGRGYYGRSRTVCRWVDGYYGPVRRCFRVR